MSKLPLSVLAIIKHDDEIFFINRQNHLRVFPGYCSFPGGKVDRKEREFKFENVLPKLFGAMARELMEELRYHVIEDIEKKNVLNIRQIGQAITPDFNPYRFEAHYLLIEVREKPNFTLCKNEIKEAFWMSSKEMRTKFKEGGLLVIPPMWKVLDYLDNSRDGLESFNLITQTSKVPCLESIHGVKQFMPLSNTLPPAERTNAFLIGDTLVDPSPKDEEELNKLLNTLPHDQIKKVFITHHHGDHHNLSTTIARKLGISVLLSRYTYERIIEIEGEEHFVGINTTFSQEGDCITAWLGKKVLVHEIPGHDEGHLALAPESLEWFIAGDLFQGVGTVVIGGREGNMTKYFNSLEKIISLKPKSVYPSHGIVLGGTGILEKTLEHRKLREEQIKKMYELGLTEQQMLERIYFDLPSKLHRYALANINSHLQKLKEEQEF